MTDWELIVPGMGLTVLGLAGVGLSLAGIAKTFVEGMHAISALMMFIGMIILAAGILKDGLPRSNQAKAAAMIIVGFAVTAGAFAVGGDPVIVTYIGIMFLILIPAVAIAWAASKRSPYLRGIAILFTSAAVVGVIALTAFGAIAPQPTQETEEETPNTPEPEEIPEEPKGPVVEVSIPEGAFKEGSLAYNPEKLSVNKGEIIVWTNNDTVAHTVTDGSGFDDPDFGKLFDSSAIQTSKKFFLDTSKLEHGEYEYFCTFHAFMKGKFTVVEGVEKPPEDETTEETGEEKKPDVTVRISEVTIPVGSGDPNNTEFYVSSKLTVDLGTMTRTDDDSISHTVTSGEARAEDTGTIFDSSMTRLIEPIEPFQHPFNGAETIPYFYQLHFWMTGKVIVK